MSPRLRNILRWTFFVALFGSILLSLNPDSGQGEFFAWIQGGGQKLAFAVLLVSGLALIATSPTAGAPGRFIMTIVFGLGFGMRMLAFVVVQPFQAIALTIGLSLVLLSVLTIGLKPVSRISVLVIFLPILCGVGAFWGLGQLVNSEQKVGLVRPPEAELPEGLFGGEQQQVQATPTFQVLIDRLCVGERLVVVEGGTALYDITFETFPLVQSLGLLPRLEELPLIPINGVVNHGGTDPISLSIEGREVVLVRVTYLYSEDVSGTPKPVEVVGYVNAQDLGGCSQE